MRGIIICNGFIKNTQIITENLQKDDVIICCDGGAKYTFCEGIVPNYIVGDLDSLEEAIINFYKIKNVNFKKFPTEKDKTDTEIAIELAKNLNIKELLIFGAVGNRFDHSLANVHILLQALQNNIFAKIVDEKNEITVINKYTEFFGNKGDLISLLPLSTEVFDLTTDGLKYALKNFNLKIGSSLGISNVFEKTKATINLSKGYLIVIKSKD